jgi:hypothetical protein
MTRAQVVADLITPISSTELLDSLDRQYFREFAGPPLTPEACALFCAQSALETGRWKAVHCFNIGNIKTGALAAYDGLVCQFRCSEIIHGEERWFDPPDPQCNFRAYDDLDSAVLAYLQFLSQRRRYAEAWRAALAGDPYTFIHALAVAGYFTANADGYTKAVVSLHAKYLAECKNGPSLAPTEVGDDLESLRKLVIASQFDIEL